MHNMKVEFTGYELKDRYGRVINWDRILNTYISQDGGVYTLSLFREDGNTLNLLSSENIHDCQDYQNEIFEVIKQWREHND